MTTNRTMAGGAALRGLSPRSWARPPGLALLALALVGLVQSGCQTPGCDTCGLGSKISNGVQSLAARVFNHKSSCGGGSDCGCGGSEGAIYDSGTTVIPGGMAIPAPGTIVPAPAIESAPSQLEAIPSSSIRNPPNGNTKSGYTTMLPKGGVAANRGASTNVARALHSSPDRSGEPVASVDLLDNIPPVDLPTEVTRKALNTTTGVGPATTPAVAPVPVPAANNAAPTPAEKVSAAEGAMLILPPINAQNAHQAPGIRRFASVAPSVGGGSGPSMDGLDWLKEKGYRTFIDLRRGSEVEPNFVDAVNDRDMVYISLPIVANRLDASRLARFDDLISQSENRPLYFCDSDGTRAGLAWYIHLRNVDQEDSQGATGKAEEIGLTEVEAKIAEQYLATHKPRARAAMARVASANPAPASEPNPLLPPTHPPVSPTRTSAPATPLPGPSANPSPSVEPTPSMLPGEEKPQAGLQPIPGPGFFRDPGSWRPVAALVLTGIGVPLAYWSRSAFSVARTGRKRASLPGSAPRSLDAPAGSDA